MRAKVGGGDVVIMLICTASRSTRTCASHHSAEKASRVATVVGWRTF